MCLEIATAAQRRVKINGPFRPTVISRYVCRRLIIREIDGNPAWDCFLAFQIRFGICKSGVDSVFESSSVWFNSFAAILDFVNLIKFVLDIFNPGFQLPRV